MSLPTQPPAPPPAAHDEPSPVTTPGNRGGLAAVTAEQFSLLIDALPVLISYVDTKERYRFNNKGYEDWFGRPRERIFGQSVRDVLGEAAYQVVRPYLRRALAGERVTFERSTPYRHGGIRHVLATYIPDRHRDGQVRGVFVLVEDISARKAAENALRRAHDDLDERVKVRTAELEVINDQLRWQIAERQAVEASLREREMRLQSILDASLDAIVAIDENEMIETFNPAAERIFGFTAAEAVGRRIDILMPDNHVERHHRSVQRYLKGGLGSLIGRVRQVAGQRKNGERFALELSIGEINFNGRRRFVAFARDISARLQTERIAADQRAELARLLRLNTLGEMAASLAHELNQPLSAIVGYTQGCLRLMQAQGRTSAEIIDYMERTVTQARRAGDIVQHIRRFLRRETTVRARVDINELVWEAVALVSAEAAYRGITIAIETSPSPPRPCIERIALEQVILNLISNSIDAMSGMATPTRVVTVTVQQPRAAEVVVTVRDTGPGLPPEIADRVFDPFVTSKEQGLGLGLSICRSIIEEHGGRLWADPDCRDGAVFRFSLPIDPETDTAPTAPGAGDPLKNTA